MQTKIGSHDFNSPVQIMLTLSEALYLLEVLDGGTSITDIELSERLSEAIGSLRLSVEDFMD